MFLATVMKRRKSDLQYMLIPYTVSEYFCCMHIHATRIVPFSLQQKSQLLIHMDGRGQTYVDVMH